MWWFSKVKLVPFLWGKHILFTTALVSSISSLPISWFNFFFEPLDTLTTSKFRHLGNSTCCCAVDRWDLDCTLHFRNDRKWKRRSSAQAATLRCDRCHRSFFGPRCLENHFAYSTVIGKKANPSKKIKNVCATQHKCPTCRRLLRPSELETKHECGTAECPSCKEYHNLCHQCFIQNPKDLEDKKKRKQRKRKADGSQATPEKRNHLRSLGHQDHAKNRCTRF